MIGARRALRNLMDRLLFRRVRAELSALAQEVLPSATTLLTAQADARASLSRAAETAAALTLAMKTVFRRGKDQRDRIEALLAEARAQGNDLTHRVDSMDAILKADADAPADLRERDARFARTERRWYVAASVVLALGAAEGAFLLAHLADRVR